jgi:hypothetical protein
VAPLGKHPARRATKTTQQRRLPRPTARATKEHAIDGYPDVKHKSGIGKIHGRHDKDVERDDTGAAELRQQADARSRLPP